MIWKWLLFQIPRNNQEQKKNYLKIGAFHFYVTSKQPKGRSLLYQCHVMFSNAKVTCDDMFFNHGWYFYSKIIMTTYLEEVFLLIVVIYLNRTSSKNLQNSPMLINSVLESIFFTFFNACWIRLGEMFIWYAVLYEVQTWLISSSVK